jgi:hypothetical protein
MVKPKKVAHCPFCPEVFPQSMNQREDRIRLHIKQEHSRQSLKGIRKPQTKRSRRAKNKKRYWRERFSPQISKKRESTDSESSTESDAPCSSFDQAYRSVQQSGERPVKTEVISSSPESPFLSNPPTLRSAKEDAEPSFCPFCGRSFAYYQHFREASIRIHCLEEHSAEVFQRERDSGRKFSPVPPPLPPPPLFPMGTLASLPQLPPPVIPGMWPRLPNPTALLPRPSGALCEKKFGIAPFYR